MNIPGARINTDTPKEREMFLTLESKFYRFREFAPGLYYYNTKNPEVCDKFEVTEVENKDKPHLMINQRFKL